MQYDLKINEYRTKVDEIDKEIANNDGSDAESNIENLNKSKDEYYTYITTAEVEKTQALTNLENQKLLELEQMIEDINNKNISILTEKGTISAEKITICEKIEEYENYISKYNIQDNNCKIIGTSTGYYYEFQKIEQGSYIQEGNTIGKIYPEKESDFYAEVYVENSDIGSIKEGQSVNLEIAAYP